MDLREDQGQRDVAWFEHPRDFFEVPRIVE